ncbi:DNA repair protein complementing XP-A cells-like [Penaeus monodon]|uniref:DNA repair protein complementing XP-A cells-like n=1 Tax=Penaeus monodon TaxID=6687 RepID=UPI0018A74981|nr:DNA repair protein complementing XP-A cells-like [Penaeus monodon]
MISAVLGPIMSVEKKDSVKVIRMQDTKLIDTGGGFFIEENENPGNEITDDDMDAAMKLVTEPAPLFEEDRPFCLECDHPFNNSFLFHNFDHPVCDQCRLASPGRYLQFPYIIYFS